MRFHFPKSSNYAEYDYFTNTIHLNEMKDTHFDIVFKDGIDIDNVCHHNILAHEITHYIDCISTLRGRKLFIGIGEANHAISDPDESNMWKIINMSKIAKSIFHDDYYKMLSDTKRNKRLTDISISTTTGLRFDNNGRIVDGSDAILFTRFNEKSEFAARIPLSMESIWEGNAIATEIEFYLYEVNSLIGKGKKSEADLYVLEYKDKLTDYLFNSEMLIYTNAAHYTSKYIIESGDLFLSYFVLRILSGICSNLPDKYFETVRIPDYFIKNLNSTRLKNFIDKKDVGFLYLCLVMNFYELYDGTNFKTSEIGEVILSYSKLPPKEVIENEVLVSMENEVFSDEFIKWDDFEYYKRELKKGKVFFRIRGLFNDNNLVLIKQDNMTEFPIIFAESDEGIYYERWERYFPNEKKINEFVRACTY